MYIISKSSHSRHDHIIHRNPQASDAHFGVIAPHQWSVCIITEERDKKHYSSEKRSSTKNGSL